MASNTVHTCSSCNALNTSLIKETSLMICKNCGEVVFENVMGASKPSASPVPADWSYIQLKTEGTYKQQPFTIAGRIRLQLRNDYKNFWCAALPGGNSFWLMDSFGSLAVFPAAWHVFKGEVKDLKADQSLVLKTGLRLKGEYVEKCEAIGYEGEIGSWKLFDPGFFFIQAANRKNEIAVFTVAGKGNIDYLNGEKLEAEKLELKNIIQWDEWK